MTKSLTTSLKWLRRAKLSSPIFNAVGYGMIPKYVNSLKASHQVILWELQCFWQMAENKYALSIVSLKV